MFTLIENDTIFIGFTGEEVIVDIKVPKTEGTEGRHSFALGTYVSPTGLVVALMNTTSHKHYIHLIRGHFVEETDNLIAMSIVNPYYNG